MEEFRGYSMRRDNAKGLKAGDMKSTVKVYCMAKVYITKHIHVIKHWKHDTKKAFPIKCILTRIECVLVFCRFDMIINYLLQFVK